VKFKYESMWGGWCSNDWVLRGWGVEKYLEGVEVSLDLLDLRWVIVLRSNFGMMYGVAIRLLSQVSLSYLV